MEFTSPRVRFWLAQAIDGAARRLRRPECRRVFSDFKDPSGNLLEANLIRLAIHPADYVLKFVSFVDGSDKSQCKPRIAAFTEPGSRVVFICGRHFEKKGPGAELQIIHEILHSLGLAENPPSSDQITTRVAARCGGDDTNQVDSTRRIGRPRMMLPTPWIEARRGEEPQLAPLLVTVAIHDSAALRPRVLERAKRVTTEIYGRIGVSVTWLAGPLDAAGVPTNPAACPDSSKPLIHLQLVGRSSTPDRPPDEVGFAVPGGTLASVLVERVVSEAIMKSVDVGNLLGVAMAHEIGHLLLPRNSHSPGIMAPKIDLLLVDRGGPSFTQPQASIIRARLASMSRCEEGCC
jgi:hypothetical protein